MSQRSTCLKRIGGNFKKYKLIILDGKEEVTIGRSPDVTVCILSTMISRIHAVLKKSDTGSWTIKDNKSLNGVHVNKKKLVPQEACELHEGDIVQLGVPVSQDQPAEFVFQYYTALKVKRLGKDTTDEPCEKRVKISQEAGSGAASGPTNVSVTDTSLATSRKPHQAAGSSSPGPQHIPSPCRPGTSSSSGSRDPGTSTAQMRDPGGEHSPYNVYRRKMEEQEKMAADRVAEMEQKLKQMQDMLKAKENAQEEMAQELELEKQRREQLHQKQVEMEREKAALEERMREELEDQLQMKEAALLESLETQKKALQEEKQAIEEQLKQQLESERERDKKLADDLLQQKEKLQKVIESKEAEQRLLESQLADTRQEKDKQEAEVLRARDNILSNFAELMETELQCSICNELFIRATSLNCSHAFCSLCIAQWMKVKMECPQCRAPVTTSMRSIVLDSYIDKMVEQFNDEMKAQRQELVQGRKTEEEAFEAANKPKPAPEPAGRGGRGRGGRGRRGRGARGGARGGQVNQQTPQAAVLGANPVFYHPAIMVDSDSSDDYGDAVDGLSDDESDSDTSVSGDDGAYFGGYGRCYTCGQRGHWANGCPFR